MSEHGTYLRYNAGCRCDPCRIDLARYASDARKRRYLNGPLTVDATGSRRRLQALAVLGWSSIVISAEYRGDSGHLRAIRNGTVNTIHSSTAEQIASIYRRLSMRLPEPSHGVTITKNYAKRYGWVSGMCWDDIDDPNETPKGIRTGTSRLDADEIAELVSHGLNTPQLAERLGCSSDAIWRCLGRAGKTDVLRVLKVRGEELGHGSRKRWVA